jgi:hypothetical protein
MLNSKLLQRKNKQKNDLKKNHHYKCIGLFTVLSSKIYLIKNYILNLNCIKNYIYL